MNNKKLNLTAVSYLNTKPFLYGIFKNQLDDYLNLQLDIPAECARKLEAGEADLGLVPVAILPQLKEYEIVSDYCIGTVGAVKTVCIYSQQPLEELTHLYLDYHSRTSVELTKLLLQDYWQFTPTLLRATPGYLRKLKGKTGGLVIGDRTIGLEEKFDYVYDLGEAWLQHTGLPFVFAAWVSTQPLETTFLQQFNEALHMGIAAIPQLNYLLQSPHPDFDLEEYFTHHISYELDADKRKGLSLFLKMLQTDSRTTERALRATC